MQPERDAMGRGSRHGLPGRSVPEAHRESDECQASVDGHRTGAANSSVDGMCVCRLVHSSAE